MNNFILTDLINLMSVTIPAQNPTHALNIARGKGYTGMFYSIEVQEHKVNRWNINNNWVTAW